MDFGTDEYKPITVPNYNLFNNISKEIRYVAPSIIDIPIKSGFVDQDANIIDILFYIIVIYIVLTLFGIKKEMEKHSIYLENILQNNKR